MYLVFFYIYINVRVVIVIIVIACKYSLFYKNNYITLQKCNNIFVWSLHRAWQIKYIKLLYP